MTDEELIQEWQETWEEMEDCGGQSSDAADFISQGLSELEAELQRRGLQPTFTCSYAPFFCPYGCPGSRTDYWQNEEKEERMNCKHPKADRYFSEDGLLEWCGRCGHLVCDHHDRKFGIPHPSK